MRKTTPKKTEATKSRKKNVIGRGYTAKALESISPETRLKLFEITRDDLRNELEVFIEKALEGERSKLFVRAGQMVAEQVAGLSHKADKEAELERLDFFAACVMEALLRLTQRSEFTGGSRESIAHEAFEMARVMVDHGKTLVK